MNETFIRTQKEKEKLLWFVGPSFISKGSRLIGSVIYEDY